MDITIKGIPTQEIVDRLFNIALRLVEEYKIAQASALNEAEKQSLDSEINQWKIENNIAADSNSLPTD
jgi:hypothetical protein